MKTRAYILLFLSLVVAFGYAQSDPERPYRLTSFDTKLHRQIYRIEIGDYQVIELIGFKDGTHRGTLTNRVWKTNRKEIRRDPVIQQIGIPKATVQRLMAGLKGQGMETLKDCEAIENCILGLDGTLTAFLTINAQGPKTATFWELTSDYYYDQQELEVPAEVLKARNLISVIQGEFDFSGQFESFLDRLPSGRYAYNMIILKKG